MTRLNFFGWAGSVAALMGGVACGSSSDPANGPPSAGSSNIAGASGTLGAGGSLAGGGNANAGSGGRSSAGTAGSTANAGAGGLPGEAGGTAGVSGGGGGSGGNSGNPSASAGDSGSAGTSHGGSSGSSGGGSAGNSTGGSGGTNGPLPDVTVWIAGDSTVATGGPCPIGWGGQFAPYFTSQVKVQNSAVAGRSVRTWLYDVQSSIDSQTGECALGLDPNGQPTIQARWTAMLSAMKPGDYLFIQFGINDSDSACPRHVGLDAFESTYGMMANAAKDRGAQPVFVTPVSAIGCTGSTAHGTRGSFVTATEDAGTKYHVPVVDLHALSVALYNSLAFCPIPGGGDVSASTTGAVGAFFCDDHTHFDKTGAVQIAKLVAQALKDQGIGLASYLK